MRKASLLLTLVMAGTLGFAPMTNANLIRAGSTGLEVTVLQSELKRVGYFAGQTNGLTDTTTIEAIKQFQTSQGLTPDGLVGPKTQQALDTAYQDILLTAGSRGIDVTILQAKLTLLGYPTGPIDGIFGTKTKQAVMSFQTNQGLTPDGKVGKLTHTALNKAYYPIILTNTTPTPTQPQQTKSTSITTYAKTFIGTPYKWGGTTPRGFDCSGFIQYVYANQGIPLPRVSKDQFTIGTPVTYANLKAGDLVFFDTLGSGRISHNGIYLGDNKFIHASSSKGITIATFNTYWFSVYRGAKRVL